MVLQVITSTSPSNPVKKDILEMKEEEIRAGIWYTRAGSYNTHAILVKFLQLHPSTHNLQLRWNWIFSKKQHDVNCISAWNYKGIGQQLRFLHTIIHFQHTLLELGKTSKQTVATNCMALSFSLEIYFFSSKLYRLIAKLCCKSKGSHYSLPS